MKIKFNHLALKIISIKKNIQLQDISNNTGLLRQTLNMNLKNETLKIKDLLKICNYLQLDPSTFFKIEYEDKDIHPTKLNSFADEHKLRQINHLIQEVIDEKEKLKIQIQTKKFRTKNTK